MHVIDLPRGPVSPNASAEEQTVIPHPTLRQLPSTSDRARAELLGSQDGARQRAVRAGHSIRVLVAQAQPSVRAGYRALLESEGAIAVVGEVACAADAVAFAAKERPDVLLLDLALPGLEDQPQTTRLISDPALAGVAVMVIAPDEPDERVLGALAAGSAGVLGKDAGEVELIRGVYMLALGHALISPDILRRLVRLPRFRSGHRRPAVEQLAELTDREREVVALVARGLSNGEIAEHFVISPATAKTHVSRAMVKLGARDRVQLVVLGYESGLVQPGPDAPSSGATSGAAGRPFGRTEASQRRVAHPLRVVRA